MVDIFKASLERVLALGIAIKRRLGIGIHGLPIEEMLRGRGLTAQMPISVMAVVGVFKS